MAVTNIPFRCSIAQFYELSFFPAEAIDTSFMIMARARHKHRFPDVLHQFRETREINQRHGHIKLPVVNTSCWMTSSPVGVLTCCSFSLGSSNTSIPGDTAQLTWSPFIRQDRLIDAAIIFAGLSSMASTAG